MKHLTDRELVGWWLWLILLLFNVLVCAYSRDVGWMLFWAIVLSGVALECGYEYGKTERQRSSQSR